MQYGCTYDLENYISIALTIIGWIANWVFGWLIVRYGK